MMVTCNAEYWKYMPSMMPPEAPCNTTYDDAERSVMCPHNPLAPKMTPEELDALYEKIYGEPPAAP